MAAPWEKDPILKPAGQATQPSAPAQGGGLRMVVAKPADQPAAQTQAQAEGDILSVQGREIANANAARDPANDRFDHERSLRNDFEALPEVKAFKTVLPMYASAIDAADNPVGDMQIITAWAKTYDPAGSVREGDVQTAENAQSYIDKVMAQKSNFDGKGRLRPGVRRNFINEIRNRASRYGDQFAPLWSNFKQRAQSAGLDPEQVYGQHPALQFQSIEAKYLGRPVRNRDGSEGASPPGEQPMGEGDIGFAGRDEPRNPLSDEQQRAYTAFLAANPEASDEQLQTFILNLTQGKQSMDAETARGIVEHYRRFGEFAPGSAATERAPDISDVRGAGGALETADAAVRGAADIVPFADRIAAGMDTIFKGGAYDENVRRQFAINDYDNEHHFGARTTGAIAMAFALPTGAIKAGQLATTEAINAGRTLEEATAAAKAAITQRLATEGAAYGAVHGAGGEGDVVDRASQAVVEGVLGAIGGLATGKVFGGKMAEPPKTKEELPPLVNPETGRLNQPLESASPAERVAAGKEYGIDLPLGSATDRGGAIVEKGLDYSPVSAGTMNDSRRAVGEQVNDAVEGVASGYGVGKTLDAAGQAAQRGAKAWISRFDEVSSKAYEAIPISPKVSGVLDNTRDALSRLTASFQSNAELANAFQNTRLNRYLEALTPKIEEVAQPPRQVIGGGKVRQPSITEVKGGELSWDDMKAFRSHIGEEIGDHRFSDGTLKSELRALYAALSEDMRATAERQGPQALRAFERANTLYRQGQERIDSALVRILGDDVKNSPEKAAAAIQTIAKSGKGSSNIRQLADIRASLAKDGEWDEVAGALIRLGGQPLNSEGRQFNPKTFVDWYADMAEPARNLLFGDRGRKELRNALDGFVAVSQRLNGTDALRNTSMTVPGFLGAGTVGSISTAAVQGLLAPLLVVKGAAAAGANYGLGKLWTNPRFVNWATGYTKMLAGAAKAGKAPTPTGVSTQLSLLQKISRGSPLLAQEIMGLHDRIQQAFDESISEK